MGRLVKNEQIKTGSYAIGLPASPSAVRPQAAVPGQVRFNTTTSKLEYTEDGSTWNNMAHVGNVSISKDTFTTANAQVNYGPMSFTYNAGEENNVLVFVGGVFQTPLTNYNFNGNSYITLNPTSGTAGQSIVLLHKFNSTNAS